MYTSSLAGDLNFGLSLYLQSYFECSDFIDIFGIQPVPFELGNKSQLNPQVGKKISKIGKIHLYTNLFRIGKQPVFGCKIGKIKSLECVT